MEFIPVKRSKLIGSRELVDLPEFSIEQVEAKIDTGADSSALHCHNILSGRDSRGRYLKFQVLDPDHAAYRDRVFKTYDFTCARVKNTSGIVEDRFRIRTVIRIGKRKFRTGILLSDRAGMSCPVLIGRRLLKTRYYVDVSRNYLTATDDTGSLTP